MNRILLALKRASKAVDIPDKEYEPKFWIPGSHQQMLVHLEKRIHVLKRNFPHPEGYPREFPLPKSKPDVNLLKKKIALLELYYQVDNLQQLKSGMNLPKNLGIRFDEKIDMLRVKVLNRFND